jgi:Glucanosyltransferase
VEYDDRGRFLPNSAVAIDPLEDGRSCTRNIPYLLSLGINTLVIGSPRAGANHDNCMRQLQDAGIYVIVRLDGKNQDTFNNGPFLEIPWDYNAYHHAQKVIDNFQQYTNTLGFYFNIYIQSERYLTWIPETKAGLRDMKEYVKSQRYRNIPVGILMYHYGDPSIEEYFSCTEYDSGIDFWLLKAWDLSSRKPKSFSLETSCFNSSTITDQILGRYQGGFTVPVILDLECPTDGSQNYSMIQYISSNSDVFAGQMIDTWFDNKSKNTSGTPQDSSTQ